MKTSSGALFGHQSRQMDWDSPCSLLQPNVVLTSLEVISDRGSAVSWRWGLHASGLILIQIEQSRTMLRTRRLWGTLLKLNVSSVICLAGAMLLPAFPNPKISTNREDHRGDWHYRPNERSVRSRILFSLSWLLLTSGCCVIQEGSCAVVAVEASELSGVLAGCCRHFATIVSDDK